MEKRHFIAIGLFLLSTVLYQCSAQTVVSGAGASFPADLYRTWVDVYAYRVPTVTVSYQSTGSSAGKRAIKDKEVNYAGSDSLLSESDYDLPDQFLQMYPAVAGAIIFPYNIPGMNYDEDNFDCYTDPSLRLRVNQDDVVKLFVGNITTWEWILDYPENLALIGTYANATDFANEDLFMVVREDGSGTTDSFRIGLRSMSSSPRVSEDFMASIGDPDQDSNGVGESDVIEGDDARQDWGAWTCNQGMCTVTNDNIEASCASCALGSYNVNDPDGRLLQGDGNGEVASTIAGQSFAMGYTVVSSAQKNDLCFMTVENNAGYFVDPTLASLFSAQEDGIGGLDPLRLTGDIINGPGNDTYPLATYTYFILQQENFGACLSVTETISYIVWTQSTQRAAEDAEALGFSPLSAGVRKQALLRLQQVQCNGNLLPQLDIALGGGPAPSLVQTLSSVFGTGTGSSVQASVDFEQGQIGVQEALDGSVDFSIGTQPISTDQAESLAEFPLLVQGISFTYLIDDFVFTGADSNEPLVLSLQVISDILSGRITQFSDSAIVALNPDVLGESNQNLTNATDTIIIVHNTDQRGVTNAISRLLEDAGTNPLFTGGTTAGPDARFANPNIETISAAQGPPAQYALDRYAIDDTASTTMLTFDWTADVRGTVFTDANLAAPILTVQNLDGNNISPTSDDGVSSAYNSLAGSSSSTTSMSRQTTTDFYLGSPTGANAYPFLSLTSLIVPLNASAQNAPTTGFMVDLLSTLIYLDDGIVDEATRIAINDALSSAGSVSAPATQAQIDLLRSISSGGSSLLAIDACLTSDNLICSGQGDCVASDDGSTSECRCDSGFEGTLCEKKESSDDDAAQVGGIVGGTLAGLLALFFLVCAVCILLCCCVIILLIFGGLGVQRVRANAAAAAAEAKKKELQNIQFGEFMIEKKKTREVGTDVDTLFSSLPFIRIIGNWAVEEENFTVLRAILIYYTAAARVEEMLIYFVKEDLANTKRSTLFRQSTAFNIMFKWYSLLVGVPYLRNVFHVLLHNVYGLSGLGDGRSEYDMTDEATAFDASSKVSRELLRYTIQKQLDVLETATSSFPEPLSRVLKLIHTEIEGTYSLDEATLLPLMGTLVFLQYFCAALTQPQIFGLMDNMPEGATLDALVQISRILQKIANGTTFSEKDTRMNSYNSFIEENFAVTNNILREVITDVDVETAVEIPPHVRKNVRQNMLEFVLEHKDHLSTQINRGELGKEVTDLFFQVAKLEAVEQSSEDVVIEEADDAAPMKRRKAMYDSDEETDSSDDEDSYDSESDSSAIPMKDMEDDEDETSSSVEDSSSEEDSDSSSD